MSYLHVKIKKACRAWHGAFAAHTWNTCVYIGVWSTNANYCYGLMELCSLKTHQASSQTVCRSELELARKSSQQKPALRLKAVKEEEEFEDESPVAGKVLKATILKYPDN